MNKGSKLEEVVRERFLANYDQGLEVNAKYNEATISTPLIQTACFEWVSSQRLEMLIFKKNFFVPVL